MRSFEQDDVFRSMHVMDGILLPDGRSAIYQALETLPGKRREEERTSSSLWRVDLAGEASRRLTAKGQNAASPVASLDGKSVLFLSTRDVESKHPQVYRLPLDGGEAEPITSAEQGVAAFVLSPDGQWIAFTAFEKSPAPSGPKEHVRITRSAYRLDRVPGYLQDARQALYLMSLSEGDPRALTPHEGLFTGLAWSPDSREIAAVVSGRESGCGFLGGLGGELCVVDREGRETVLHDYAVAMGLFWTPDARQVGFFGIAEGDLSREWQLWLIDRETAACRSRTSRLDRSVGGLVQMNNPAMDARTRTLVAADGSFVIAPVVNGGEWAPYRIALSGPESAEPVLRTAQRAARPLDLAGTTLLFAPQDCHTPSELWTADLGTGAERALTSHNAAWQREIEWPELERVVASTPSGTQVEGWVLKPRGAREPQKTVLYIHGKRVAVAHG